MKTANLSESLCIGAHVSENDEDVLLTLVSQVLSRREGQTRRDDALNAEMNWWITTYRIFFLKLDVKIVWFKSEGFQLTSGH